MREGALLCTWSEAPIRRHTPDAPFGGIRNNLGSSTWCLNCLRKIVHVQSPSGNRHLSVWVRTATFQEWP